MAAAVIYCRCSTEEESQVDALQKQVIEAERSVRENGWVLVDRYVESKSGTTSKGREEYNRLFEDMQTEKFEIIVIKSQDRLMRNTKDWYIFLDRMLTNGKRLFLYLERKFYSADDSLITGIKAILAEEYSRELSKKIVNAHRHRQRFGGKVMLTNNVFGFRKMADGSVEIVEEEAAVIRQMYELCAQGYGARTISNILMEKGVRSKRGHVINAGRIRGTIRNPLYKGIFVMNRQHFDFEAKKLKKLPKEEWIFQEGIVPAIVEPELWERANEAMSRRAKEGHRDGTYGRGSNPGKYILSGKLVCGKCGNPYYRTWRRAQSRPDQIIYEWKCKEYVEHGRAEKNRRDQIRKIRQESRGCDNSHLDENIIFMLLEKFSERYYGLDEGEKKKIIEKTMETLELALNQNHNRISVKKLERSLKGLEDKKQLLMDKLLDRVITDDDFKRQNGRLDQEIEKIKGEMYREKERVAEQEDLERRLKTIRDKLEKGGLEKATAGQMLKDIDKIIVHEWQLEIQFFPVEIREIVMSGYDGKAVSVFIDYPFPPDTEKGRILDRSRIFEYIKANPEATAKNVAGEIGRSVYTVRNRIGELVQGGYIQDTGKGGHGKWEILKDREADCSDTAAEQR